MKGKEREVEDYLRVARHHTQWPHTSHITGEREQKHPEFLSVMIKSKKKHHVTYIGKALTLRLISTIETLLTAKLTTSK